jgi:aspartate/methionine/tyrosine aminotransferase
MNALAEELNKALAGGVAERLLSELGKRIYFPKGIVAQSAEADARANRFNATIGMACEGGQPLELDAIRSLLPSLSSREAVAYAPTAGVAALRSRWKDELYAKNPSLKGKEISLPVVVPGLTAAISLVVDLFLDEGDEIVLPELSWPNYRLIVEERKAARCAPYPFFAAAAGGRGFNVQGLEEALRASALRAAASGKAAKAACILNFPNNPTGYSLTLTEADALVASLRKLGDEGISLLVVADDAYFGLQYEEALLRESIFARVASCHPNILAVKADGPTKEDYVWGFRLGFISFASASLAESGREALVKKLMGLLRSSVSSSSAPAQSLILKSLGAPGVDAQKRRFRGLLESRYAAAKAFLDSKPLPSSLAALPFNSGYFMSFECLGVSAEALRVKLLSERGIGVCSIQDRYLRVAFSGVDESSVGPLFAEIAAAAAELSSIPR